MIGTFAASNNWNDDVVMETEGDWAVARNVTLANGDKFKFRANKSWDNSNPNYGCSEPVDVGNTYKARYWGSDIVFAGEDGSYNIYFSLLDAKFYIEKN